MLRVKDEEGRSAQQNGEISGEPGETRAESGVTKGDGSGWTTTKAAAKALGVSRRMVQEYVRRGELEAVAEGEGVARTYYVAIESLNALRERRRGAAKNASGFAGLSAQEETPAKSGEMVGEALIRTIERLEARASEAAELRVRLELTGQAESTLREELERERERADRLEAELKEIREHPFGARGASASDEGGGEGQAEEEGGRRRSWLYRFFFGP